MNGHPVSVNAVNIVKHGFFHGRDPAYLFPLFNGAQLIGLSVKTVILPENGLCPSARVILDGSGIRRVAIVKERGCDVVILLEYPMGIEQDFIGIQIAVDEEDITQVGAFQVSNTVLQVEETL